MSAELPGYVLHDRIGGGAHATVWRAERAGRPGRVLAVKRLHTTTSPEAVASFRREIDALARLSHPGILRLLDIVDDGDRVALILPYVPGGSLAGRIARADPRLTAGVVADLGARLGRALAGAHDAGLVHRDVKPANILFDAEGAPLLADFGTALLRGGAAPAAGTAEYLDPEVAAGRPAGPASDIYGLGVACYEALTGTPPYAGSTPGATLAAADRGVHVPLATLRPDLPAPVIATIEAAMARRPEDRPSTAVRLASHLEEARLRLEAAGVVPGSPSAQRPSTRPLGPAPPPPPPAAPPPAPPGPRRWWVALAVAALLIPAVVVWWLTRDATGTPAPVLLETLDPTDPAAPEAASPPTPTPTTTTPPLTTPVGVLASPAPPCEHLPTPSGDGEDTFLVDVDGRGCSTVVAWDGRILTVPRADGSALRYDLDAADEDVLLFGDWNCDGRESPALYRPASGEAFRFAGFAEPGEEVTVHGEPTGVIDGHPRVLVDEAGCHHLDVQPTAP